MNRNDVRPRYAEPKDESAAPPIKSFIKTTKILCVLGCRSGKICRFIPARLAGIWPMRKASFRASRGPLVHQRRARISAIPRAVTAMASGAFNSHLKSRGFRELTDRHLLLDDHTATRQDGASSDHLASAVGQGFNQLSRCVRLVVQVLLPTRPPARICRLCE